MRPILARLTHAWRDIRHAGHDFRVAIHLAKHLPLFDRLGVALSILAVFWLGGEALSREHVLEVFAYAICETVAKLIDAA